jgi:hypothetical protein
MANDSKKISELNIATALSANDRVVVLTNPNTSSAAVKTISTNNFANSVGNYFPSGTFNPNFSTNTGNVISIGTQTGHYTRIGKLCYFRAFLQFSNSSYEDGGGQYQMTLPFPSTETISIRNSTLHNPNTSTVYNMGGVLDIASNSTLINLYYNSSASDIPWTNITPLNWPTGNSTHFDISGIYETT